MLGIPITKYQKSRRGFHWWLVMSYRFTVDMTIWNSVHMNKYTNSIKFKYGSSSLDVSMVLIMYFKLHHLSQSTTGTSLLSMSIVATCLKPYLVRISFADSSSASVTVKTFVSVASI